MPERRRKGHVTKDELREGKVIVYDVRGRIFYVAKEENFITRAVARISAMGHGIPRKCDTSAGIRKKTNGGTMKENADIFLHNIRTPKDSQ